MAGAASFLFDVAIPVEKNRGNGQRNDNEKRGAVDSLHGWRFRKKSISCVALHLEVAAAYISAPHFSRFARLENWTFFLKPYSFRIFTASSRLNA